MKPPLYLKTSIALIAVFLSPLLVLFSANAQQAGQIRLVPNSTITLTPRGMSQEETINLQGEYTIGADGNISGLYLLPNSGILRAAGKTPEQLARAIEQAYISNGIYTRIRVTIQTNDVALNQTFTVGGEVNKLGSFPWKPGITLIRAITDAGGRSQFAADKVVVDRRGQSIELNLSNPQDRNFVIQANDYISVWEQGILKPKPPSR